MADASRKRLDTRWETVHRDEKKGDENPRLHANGMVRALCKAGARLLALPVVLVLVLVLVLVHTQHVAHPPGGQAVHHLREGRL
jgi:hypothetical protein